MRLIDADALNGYKFGLISPYAQNLFHKTINEAPTIDYKRLLEQEACTDAISRQAVIDMTGLSEWFDSSDSYNKFVSALSELPSVKPQYTDAEIQKMQDLEFAEIQKAYEIGKAENPNRWIPVSERLPEKNMACLVAVGKFNLTQMAMYSDLMGTIDHRIFYQGDYGYDSFEDITEYVKAWMPLPLPYKASPTGEEVEE